MPDTEGERGASCRSKVLEKESRENLGPEQRSPFLCVFSCCRKKLLQTWRHRTTQAYYFTLVQGRSVGTTWLRVLCGDLTSPKSRCAQGCCPSKRLWGKYPPGVHSSCWQQSALLSLQVSRCIKFSSGSEISLASPLCSSLTSSSVSSHRKFYALRAHVLIRRLLFRVNCARKQSTTTAVGSAKALRQEDSGVVEELKKVSVAVASKEEGAGQGPSPRGSCRPEGTRSLFWLQWEVKGVITRPGQW